MQHQSQKITYGAMMMAFFTVLLVGAFYIPLLGIIIMLLIPLPIILYRLRYDRSSTVFVILAGTLLTLLIGGVPVIPFAFVFGLLGFLIAESLQLGKSKIYTFMASALFFIIIGMVFYVVGVFLFDFNIVNELFDILENTRAELITYFEAAGMAPQLYEGVIENAFVFYRSAVPAIFILGVFVFTYMMVIPNFEVLRRLGHNVPRFSPFRTLKLPVILIFVYGVTILLPYITDLKPESSLYLMYINATVILRTLLLIQGLSLIFYIMHRMKAHWVLTFFTTLLAIAFSPITTLLGILDIGMNVRSFIEKDNRK
ncbi:DUF2232 domain-containing protein [Sporosarcina oncorhynchi]|uniref:DUF2232 domain-containing protein n=1 Tax=Sporosarcina oncorhynchi TaxID=3056444 RepID=A0ABZ0L4N3_9BACL|nr:DUF2232 domain-containing protein [Sporosarcina sp. T2O-4]WOV87549.1 DUF2232 domain-containing protein [Sporosarcina sp. T2O-4]